MTYPGTPNRLEQTFLAASTASARPRSATAGTWSRPIRVRVRFYARLLEKIEIARARLGGRVYDVLGRLFEAPCSSATLLIDAIRYR